MKKSKRLSKVQASLTLAITAKAAAMKAEGLNIISFGAGEPDFNTPQPIIDAAKTALDNGMTKYTAVAGMPALRAEIAAWYEREFGVKATADQVIVGVGGKQVIYNAIMSLIDDGDVALIPSPYWLSYPAMVHLAGGSVEFIDTTEEDGFLITPAMLEDAILKYQPTLLVLNSPCNPTGQAYDEMHLRALAEVLRKYPDITILWDNIYAHLTYGEFKHLELAKVAPDLRSRIIVTGGFSKSFAMTGWRLGFAIADPERIKLMSTIQSHSTSNATSFAQAGALEALRLDHTCLDEMRHTFETRRSVILECIAELPDVSCLAPKGAFYVLINCKKYCNIEHGLHWIQNDLDLAKYILEEGHVATIPGSAFGAPGYLRLSFALDEDNIRKGIARIGESLKKLNA
ncbi:MAG: pyridoxal phosphate-dependent aminotransferase [Proteobacteria bacterium]|nr:pyridoxal phosphate-dependent aminotransferase [Pseudomonadota bacterium]